MFTLDKIAPKLRAFTYTTSFFAVTRCRRALASPRAGSCQLGSCVGLMTELPRALDQDHSRIETQPEEHGHEQRKFPTKQALPFHRGGNRNHDRAGDDGRGCGPCSPGLDPGSRSLDAARHRGGIYTETQNRGTGIFGSRGVISPSKESMTELMRQLLGHQRALNCCHPIDGPRRGQVGARRETIVTGWHPWAIREPNPLYPPPLGPTRSQGSGVRPLLYWPGCNTSGRDVPARGCWKRSPADMREIRSAGPVGPHAGLMAARFELGWYPT